MSETLYSGGLIFDGVGARLEGHAVLTDGAEIKRVAPVGEFDGFAGIAVDTSGGTLLPGLIDCHVHLIFVGAPDPYSVLVKQNAADITLTALENAQKNLRAGITAVRDCGGKDYLELSVRNMVNRGTFQGPTIHCSGKMICMTGGHGNRNGRVADGPDEVIKAVRENIHAGSDLIKIMATGGVVTPGVNPEDAHYTFEEMQAGVSEARRFHKRTASHAQGTLGILNAVRAGIHSIEHGIFMDHVCLTEMKDRGTFLVPTLAAIQSMMDNSDQVPAYMMDKVARVAERHAQSFKEAYEAGISIAMGTDAGTPFNRHGENTQELRLMVRGGMTPTDALKATTYNGSELMGLEELGRIREGAQADMLIVDGDPTTDIEMVADRINHRMVVKAGKPVV